MKREPLTVRLRFEPAGRSVGDVGRYYQLAKENKCVVCGGENSYIRKNVVPREYRRFFLGTRIVLLTILTIIEKYDLLLLHA